MGNMSSQIPSTSICLINYTIIEFKLANNASKSPHCSLNETLRNLKISLVHTCPHIVLENSWNVVDFRNICEYFVLFGLCTDRRRDSLVQAPRNVQRERESKENKKMKMYSLVSCNISPENLEIGLPVLEVPYVSWGVVSSISHDVQFDILSLRL